MYSAPPAGGTRRSCRATVACSSLRARASACGTTLLLPELALTLTPEPAPALGPGPEPGIPWGDPATGDSDDDAAPAAVTAAAAAAWWRNSELEPALAAALAALWPLLAGESWGAAGAAPLPPPLPVPGLELVVNELLFVARAEGTARPAVTAPALLPLVWARRGVLGPEPAAEAGAEAGTETASESCDGDSDGDEAESVDCDCSAKLTSLLALALELAPVLAPFTLGRGGTVGGFALALTRAPATALCRWLWLWLWLWLVWPWLLWLRLSVSDGGG